MSALADLFTMVAVSAGILFFLAGVVGLLRFPDALTRLHALTKADNVGLGLIVVGLLPQAGSPLEALKLVLVWAIKSHCKAIWILAYCMPILKPFVKMWQISSPAMGKVLDMSLT